MESIILLVNIDTWIEVRQTTNHHGNFTISLAVCGRAATRPTDEGRSQMATGRPLSDTLQYCASGYDHETLSIPFPL